MIVRYLKEGEQGDYAEGCVSIVAGSKSEAFAFGMMLGSMARDGKDGVCLHGTKDDLCEVRIPLRDIPA
jgi:hypothetical protein